MLDSGLLRRLRLERNLTERSLANAIGRSPSVVRQLEKGHGHEAQTLAVLWALSQVLGVRPAALLTDDPDVELHDDETHLEAALATLGIATSAAALARGFGWSLQRTVAGLTALRTHRQDSGIRVQHHAGKWRLLPARDVVPEEVLRRITRTDIGQRRMSISLARILRQVAAGDVGAQWLKNASVDQRNGLMQLQRLGWVREHDSNWLLSDDTNASLRRAPMTIQPPPRPPDPTRHARSTQRPDGQPQPTTRNHGT